MNYNDFGSTGIKVPPIIFGTSALGNLYASLPFETKKEIIRECFSNVERPVFDCAGKYGAGMALEMLGKCLRDLDIKSDEVIISNKLGWVQTPLNTPEPTFEKGVWHDLKNDAVQQISYEGILKCWEQGNELLGGIYKPQLVSVHDPDEYINQAKNNKEKESLLNNIFDAYKALSDLKKQKKVRAVGVGAKNWKIIEEISNNIELDWVMFANSMTIMHHPDDLLEFMKELHKKGVAIINSAVFHAGFLTGGEFFDYKLIHPDTEENIAIFKWREDFFRLCKKFEVLPSVACVTFAMTPPGVVSISLNTSNPKRVKNNVDSVMTKIPAGFWKSMKSEGLINKNYPYLND